MTAAFREPRLTEAEQALLNGDDGPAQALAMRVVVDLARACRAERLVRVSSAHVDGCLYHGEAGLEFAERLVRLGARVTIPTTLNVGSLDLLHPQLVRGRSSWRSSSRALMDAYVALGAHATWTCAPYQVGHRPERGEDVAWAESNAIVFANSVLGARTDRYGDFLDICAAVTGRAPYTGLHRAELRRGQVVLDLRSLPHELLRSDLSYPLIGHLAGRRAGRRVPVLVGLPPDTGEDRLKALGASAASSGGVALFHAVGLTPEAPTLADALHHAPAEETVTVTVEMLTAVLDELNSGAGDSVDAVSVGTPHFSAAEFAELHAIVARAGREFEIPFYVCTSRGILAQAEAAGDAEPLRRAGATIVVDTCTYVTPILAADAHTVMTNSGKWAHYAPVNLGVAVVMGSLETCVDVATRGGVTTRADDRWWTR